MKNNLYTISAHLPFADTLARWLLEREGAEPLVLARTLVLLPSRRAASALREAFLRVSGGRPLLLPRVEPLGETQEDALLLSPPGSGLPQQLPPDGFSLRRLFTLARLIRARGGAEARMDHALKLGGGLAELLDELEREEVSLDGIAGIVPDAFAAHWQETVEFLQILSRHWPEIAAEEKLISPGLYQGQVLHALAKHWREAPPPYPVIAAGTTGSIPATADLLAAIAALPDGAVVLPGLDKQADEAYFDALAEGHPQWGMAQLLKKFGVEREEVQPIGEGATPRVKLMSEVMRPAEVTEEWRRISLDRAEALKGLHTISCADLQEEANVAALLLREALETPGKTAALVTHNRGLARRVAASMRRFGVTIDDSAGMALKETPLGGFFRLALDAAAQGMAAVPLLSLLKHPLARVGMERIACLETARAIELLVLKGLRLNDGIEGVRQALVRKNGVPQDAQELLNRLEEAFAPLLKYLSAKEAPLAALLENHLACVEALGSEAIWDAPEADEMSRFFSEARIAAQGVAIEADAYPAVFEELLAGRVVRPEYGMHPRLKILSPMEARMQSFDRVILGGLNEGGWPPATESDPWFSRPMRATLGLPAPERRLGLAAHDFFLLACGSEVFLTRAGKESGAPTLPSRWLTKLEMLTGEFASPPVSLPPLRGKVRMGGEPVALPAGVATPHLNPPPQGGRISQALVTPAEWLAWVAALDAPDAVTPAAPPAPTPPLSARPREVSVTQVETWMRDPYAFYAAQILRLRALPPLARLPDGSDFGTATHAALERFVKAHPEGLPGDALPQLLEHGRAAFDELFAGSGVEPLWWPRFRRIAEWFIAQEEKRRGYVKRVLSEADGACRINGFLLRGRADRIEAGRDDSISIIDYKTGGLPSMKDIVGGLSSQLVLLALIAREGGLGVKGNPIFLEYWRLSGTREAGEVEAIRPEKIEGLVQEAKEGLERLIARFSDPAFPYRATPIPARASRYSDYEHLARVKEWG